MSETVEAIENITLGLLNPLGERVPGAAELDGSLHAIGSMYVTDLREIPGITAGDALDAGDAIGTIFAFVVPSRGIIVGAKLIDPDDDTLALTAHIFRAAFTPTVSDAALGASSTITAQEALAWVTSIPLTSTLDLGNAKVAEVTGWNSPYASSSERLYVQCSTAGTPNIAAGLMPRLQLYILPLTRQI